MTIIIPHDHWQERAAAKRAANLEALPRSMILPDPPGAEVLDVMDLPATCGLLTARELGITESEDVTVLLGQIARAEYSALEVATAFIKRAVIAQQLVRLPFHGINLRRGISRKYDSRQGRKGSGDALEGGRAKEEEYRIEVIDRGSETGRLRCRRVSNLADIQVNCVTETFFERALKQAQKLDDHLKATGKTVGHTAQAMSISLRIWDLKIGADCRSGLPISLKDQIEVKGTECTMSYVGWLGNVPDEDALIVTILEEQGVSFSISLGCVLGSGRGRPEGPF